MGIDIGATHVSIAMTNLRGNLILWKEKKHPVRKDPAGTQKIINELCNDCFRSIGVPIFSPLRAHPKLGLTITLITKKNDAGLQGIQGFMRTQITALFASKNIRAIVF